MQTTLETAANGAVLRDCFSSSYSEARDKFIEAAGHAGAQLEHHVLEGQVGAQGEVLAMDVALLGRAGASSLLVLSSGVHGVEGFCGSGCQLALLRDSGLLEQAEEHGVALMLIHAVNPYGFSHLRRTNECNVDLNRNFIDFEQPTRNPAYRLLHDLLLPEEWPPTQQTIQALEDYIAEKGFPAYREAVTTGQSEFSDGMFYSGESPTWSNRTLRRVMRAHGANRRRVAWIDVHTGLGPRGHGEKIHAGLPGTPDNLRLTRAVWGADVVAAWEGESASRQVVGHAVSALFQECPRSENIGIALEYGTRSALESLRADQWLNRYPERASADQRAAIKRELFDAFYVDHDEWRGMIVGQCRTALLQACLALGGTLLAV
ncbi:M14 family metallopeptidase [Variovorax sp. LARHSF232]